MSCCLNIKDVFNIYRHFFKQKKAAVSLLLKNEKDLCKLLSNDLGVDVTDLKFVPMTRADKKAVRIRFRHSDGAHTHFFKTKTKSKSKSKIKVKKFNSNVCKFDENKFLKAVTNSMFPKKAKTILKKDFKNLNIDNVGKVCDLASKNVSKLLKRSVEIESFLGCGSFGITFGTRSKEALKIVFEESVDGLNKEIEMQRKAADSGLGPSVLSTVVIQGLTFGKKTAYAYKMEEIDRVLTPFFFEKKEKPFNDLVKKVGALVKALARVNIVHGDLWSDNISVDDETGQVGVIDFGWSSNGSMPVFDVVQFFRGAFIAYLNEFEYYNKNNQNPNPANDFLIKRPITMVKRLEKIYKRLVVPYVKLPAVEKALKSVYAKEKKKKLTFHQVYKIMCSIYKKVNVKFGSLFKKYKKKYR